MTSLGYATKFAHFCRIICDVISKYCSYLFHKIVKKSPFFARFLGSM